MTVGLQTFEAFLSVVQNGSPGSIFSGAYGSMRRSPQPSPLVQVMWAIVVGEDLTECRLVDEFGTFGVGCRVFVREHGELLGELVKLCRIVMILFSHSLLLLVAAARKRPAVVGIPVLVAPVWLVTFPHHNLFRLQAFAI